MVQSNYNTHEPVATVDQSSTFKSGPGDIYMICVQEAQFTMDQSLFTIASVTDYTQRRDPCVVRCYDGGSVRAFSNV